MEWAIHVANWESLGHDNLFAHQPRVSDPALSRVQSAATDVLRRVCAQVRLQRAYIGNEFCEHLIPSGESFSRLCRELQEKGLAITLLTPPVTDAGLNKLHPLFTWLADHADDAEVVFNDWGTLQILYDEFRALRPIRGRLLDKKMRDPRVTPLYGMPGAPDGIRASMDSDGLETPALQRLLRRYGVERVELDIPCQEPASSKPLPFQMAYYFPYGFVTTGRQCMIAGLHIAKAGQFRPAQTCQHECRSYVTQHCFVDTTLQTAGTTFYQRGNTVFYSPEANRLERFLQQAESSGVTRIIYQPDLPM